MQDIKALKAENIFVVLSLIMGLFYLVINPPFQAPDEAQHMFKMWGYTQGTLRFKVLQNYTGDVLPLSLIKLSRYEFMRGDTNKKITVNEIKQSLNVKLDKENKAFYTFNPTSYTPVSYFPSFLLLWVMKLLNIAPLVMMYMLRLCSLFLYTGLMYYAIKIMPVKKWLFLLWHCCQCLFTPLRRYQRMHFLPVLCLYLLRIVQDWLSGRERAGF